MSEEQTFNEWVKHLEPSMAVPMYPKALLLDFMKKSFFAGLEQHSHDYLVKTKSKITQAHTDGYNRGLAKAEEKIADIKANCDLAIEGRDVKIKELEKENAELKERLENLNLNANIAVRDLNNLFTKAREIIALGLRVCETSSIEYINLYQKRAEQFLGKVK